MEVLVYDMWTPYKEFQRVVEDALSGQGSFEELESSLQKHRQNFLTMLKNPPKDPKHREELNKGSTEGIDLHGVGHTVLPKEQVAEAIILSDMYELNEFMALDLLGTAQQQMPNYPGLPRGVVAILLYYDGRKTLVWTLRSLVQARQGNLWTIETNPQILQYITKYTDELLNDGIINKILNLLKTLDLYKELELLQRNRALGPPRYHQQVIDLFETTRQSLAEIIYLYAAQSGLPKEPTLSLLDYVRNMKPTEDASGGIDNVSLGLEMALLYAIDLSLLHREDGEAVQTLLPLVSRTGGGQFLSALQVELSSDKVWACSGLQALTQMAWAITLSTLRMVPQLVPPSLNLENPDVVMDYAIQNKVFSYLHNNFLISETIYKEEFYLRRMHNLITDFIVQMPQKVKELRLRAEETDRTITTYSREGLEPPGNLAHHFQQLLLTICRLYGSDPLELELELDFWCLPDQYHPASFPYRSQPKQSSLFSFVIQTAECLPITLYVPYLRMLCSLSSCQKGAQQCFEFLKSHDPQSHPTHKNLNWDHFFTSLTRYFNNLRQEAPPASDTVYRQRPFVKGITPAELQGLHAVLELIKTVAENDIICGEVFCQTPNWNCITVLVGLLSCAVPLSLKAQILNTLAAFAKSTSTATTLWSSLEASQLISTIPSTQTYSSRGIQGEIEELEVRNEEYPLTRAVLRLLHALTDKPIPKLLGVSSRTPGFDPYLTFILNSIVLRFYSRIFYKNPREKWEICELGMGLVAKLLLLYDPATDEFLVKQSREQFNPPPGYHIMTRLCSKTELFRMIFQLLDEGSNTLDSYSIFPGKQEMEGGLLSCLKIIEHTLCHQSQFLSNLVACNSSLLLPGMSRLILGINPASNKPDHLLTISKFITYGSWLPEHALHAVNILRLATSYPTPHGHLLSLYTSTPAIKSIRHGFVTCLEAEEVELELSEEDSTLVTQVTRSSADKKKVVTQTKKAICLFLLQCLNQGVPNVAHYLFGFDLNKELRKTVFEQPGIMGTPRSCLHSILCLLNSSLHNPMESSPSLLAMYYRILHALAANPRTSEPVLRFLRSSADFLKRHLAALPFNRSGGNCSSGAELNQMAWLLKTVGIELRVTAANKQISQLSALVEVYTGGEQTDSSSIPQDEGESMQVNPKEQLVLRLIKEIDFFIESIPVKRWDYFDLSMVDKALAECEIVDGKQKVIDLKQLHRVLHSNLSSIENRTCVVSKRELEKEMQAILTHAVKINELRRMAVSHAHFLDAWSQASEVMFAVASPESLRLEKRFRLLIDIIYELLVKAVTSNTQAEISTLSSGAVLLLSVDLRHTYISELGKGEETDSRLCVLLDSNQYKLNAILTALVKWILGSGVASQKLRANLYAALLNFLHLTREKGNVGLYRSSTNPSLSGSSRTESHFVSMLDQRVSLSSRVTGLEPVLAQGERLVDMLCHDASNGHDICKMLALSCLDMVVELDSQCMWASVLSSRGYLQFTINSLVDLDRHLVGVLSQNIKSLRPLYVYESKMALLCRVASTPNGAEILLEQTVFSALAAMNVFNKHPDITSHHSLNTPVEGFIPNVSQRYLQMLSPALSLCDAILSTLGVDNHIAVSQVLRFLMSHGEMVTQVLRSGSPFHQLCYLKELAQLTGVIARATNEEVLRELGIQGIDPGNYIESSSRFHRVQTLMFSLISRFVISESLLKDIQNETDPLTNDLKTKAQVPITFLQIGCHLLLYARNLISSIGMDRRMCSVIFQPSLAETITLDRREVLTMQEATLGVVVQQLVQAVAHHQREKGNFDLLVRKLDSVPDMSTNTLKEYLPESYYSNMTELDEYRHQARKILSEQVELKQTELKYSYFIIEHCLYIIWAHLDYYMLRGLSNKTLDVSRNPNYGGQMEHDVTWKVTSDDLNHLKQGLLSVFNDTFSKTLVATSQDMSPSDKGFLEALLRRIKKLIQFVPSS